MYCWRPCLCRKQRYFYYSLRYRSNDDYNTIGKTTGDNILNTITIKYIDEDLKKETGYSLKEFIDRGDLAERADKFREENTEKYICMLVNAYNKLHHNVPDEDCVKYP